MRELVKSAFSLSWAMSLLGLKQATNLLNPQELAKASLNDLEPVSQATINQLDPRLQGLFRTGDNLQRGMVNLMFGLFDPGNWNPSRWAPGSGSTSPCSGNQSGQSWGPMPTRPGGQ